MDERGYLEKLTNIQTEVALVKQEVKDLKTLMSDINSYLKRTDRLEFKTDWIEQSVKDFMESHNSLCKRVEIQEKNVWKIMTVGLIMIGIIEILFKFLPLLNR